MALAYRGFSLGFGNKMVLNDITFSIEEDTITGITGQSGSGKSQLALAPFQLNRHKSTQSGTIWWNNTNLCLCAEVELTRLRGATLAYIFQDAYASFNPLKTISFHFYEAIQLHNIFTGKDIEHELQNLLRQLKFEEVDRMLSSYPHQLSGGQLQRLAIALALLPEPSLIIADEITSSLDMENEAQVMDVLRQYKIKRKASILWITHNKKKALTFCDRLYEMKEGRLKLVDQVNDIPSAFVKPPASEISTDSHLLQLVHLSKSFGKETLFKDLNLTIYNNDILGLMGKSGSGKSTLIKIIAGLIVQDEGDVQWHTFVKPFEKVQIIFQHPYAAVNPTMTIRQILLEAYNILALDCNSECLNATLTRVGLNSDLLNRKPNQLSGGQLQRVCIARALCFNPRLLILDESFSALDDENKTMLTDLILDLQKKSEMSLFFVSHDRTFIESICHRVVEL